MDREQQFELAKEWYNDPNTTSDEKKFLESKFPQLNTESYYENVRKAAIALAQYCKRDGLSSSKNISIDEIINWLQGLSPKAIVVESPESISIRRTIESFIRCYMSDNYSDNHSKDDMLNWLRKQD
jgi:hypothetical protein